MKAKSSDSCVLCKQEGCLTEEFSQKSWVTSGSDVYDAEAKIVICSHCGHVQKKTDALYFEHVNEIYKNYSQNTTFSQAEQLVYTQESKSCSRSAYLIQHILKSGLLPKSGKLLEEGCGFGYFLEEWHELFPQWELFGQEYDEQYQDIVLSRPQVKAFFTKDENYSTTFDCICLNHVLEHLENPCDTLKKHYQLLNENACHFIQVPNFEKSPFDLCVFDHISHFTEQSLNLIASKSGFRIIDDTEKWNHHHMGWLAKKEQVTEGIVSPEYVNDTKKRLMSILKWIEKLPSYINQYVGKNWAILGSTQASLYVSMQCGYSNQFFVDENAQLENIKLKNKPILTPKNCPEDTKVFLPFEPVRGKYIKTRLQKQYPHISFLGIDYAGNVY